MNSERFVLRAIARDGEGELTEIIEQEIPATERAIYLAMRRWPFKTLAASALLKGGTVVWERKK